MNPQRSTLCDPYGDQLAVATPWPPTAYQVANYDPPTPCDTLIASAATSGVRDSHHPPHATSESGRSAFADAAGQHQQQQYQDYQALSVNLPAIAQTVGSAVISSGYARLAPYPISESTASASAYAAGQHQQRQYQHCQALSANLSAIKVTAGSADSSSGHARLGPKHRYEYGEGGSDVSRPSTRGSGNRGGSHTRPAVPTPVNALEGAGPVTFDFTQRESWSQHIIDESKDFLHVLAPDSTILFAAPSARDLTGWSPDELTGCALLDYIHADDVESFVRDFAALREGSSLKVIYRLCTKKDGYTLLEVTGHAHYAVNEAGIRTWKHFFGVGRPYSTNSAAFDEVLELKTENDHLRRELQDMHRSIESGASYFRYRPFARPGLPLQPDSAHNFTAKQGHSTLPSPFSNHEPTLGPLPPQSDSSSGAGLINPTSGQTSKLIPSSPIILGTNIGLGISRRESENEATLDTKRKKRSKVKPLKSTCSECGISDSPEWRKGPNGPKSLCNACGLRYTKKVGPSVEKLPRGR